MLRYEVVVRLEHVPQRHASAKRLMCQEPGTSRPVHQLGRLSCVGAAQPQFTQLLVVVYLAAAHANSTVGFYVPFGPAGLEALE